MVYRQTTPESRHCESDEEEFACMHDAIIDFVEHSPCDLLDELLMWANICEHRAQRLETTPELRVWFTSLAAILRATITTMSTKTILPDEKFENPGLYHPDPDMLH